jgi:predicted porin
MQKKIITLAVAAALTVPVAAMADVTVYGLMHYSYDYVMGDDDEGNTGVSRGSRLGFKGAEDLGGGLKGVWQIETEIESEGSSDDSGFDLRNTFVGLNGGFGTILAGRHDTPYKIATSKMDLFSDRAADYNNFAGTINGATVADERAPQTIAYITPSFNGLTAAFAYVDHYFTTPEDESDSAYSFGAFYDNAGLFLGAGYEYQEGANLTGVTGVPTATVTVPGTPTAVVDANGVPTGDLVPTTRSVTGSVLGSDPEVTAWKVGGMYTIAGFSFGALWENIEIEGDNGDLERDMFYIPLQYAFGNNVIKGYYAKADESDGDLSGGDDGADFWAIGFDHNFSKRTTLYALYTMVDNDDAGTYRANSGQAVSNGYTGSADDEDIDVISVGIIHKF